jgi:hypothetical protein
MVSGDADSVKASLVKPSHLYQTLTVMIVALPREVVEHQRSK